jgi:uncharacterized RDD family membrane protein YckC
MDNHAGFWVRVLAYIIDSIILLLVDGAMWAMFGFSVLGLSNDQSDLTGGANLWLNFVSIIIGVAYFAGMESSTWQATLGKKALGLVVTDVSGNRITFMRGVGRYFAKFLSAIILFIGFIMVAFTERKQGLHDILAGTLVLKGTPNTVGTDLSVFE